MPFSEHRDTDPFDEPEYHQFVDSMSQHCHCTAFHSPCSGVLAGGPCDGLKSFDVDDELIEDDDYIDDGEIRECITPYRFQPTA